MKINQWESGNSNDVSYQGQETDPTHGAVGSIKFKSFGRLEI